LRLGWPSAQEVDIAANTMKYKRSAETRCQVDRVKVKRKVGGKFNIGRCKANLMMKLSHDGFEKTKYIDC